MTVGDALGKLHTENQRDVLKMYLDGLKQREMAVAMRCSQARIAAILRRVLEIVGDEAAEDLKRQAREAKLNRRNFEVVAPDYDARFNFYAGTGYRAYTAFGSVPERYVERKYGYGN